MAQSDINYLELAEKIKSWGKDLGFADIGISDIDLSEHKAAFQGWLDKGFHGDMEYMARHGDLRSNVDLLHPGTIRVISARMDYLPQSAKFAETLKDPKKAYVSRYALGRDYHKLMRKRLKSLGEKISEYCEDFSYRPFVDSAPILERPLAEKAGLGWTGKHTLLINRDGGSWFFLGELLVNIPLPVSTPVQEECGTCVACMKICPTDAIVAPYEVDARRCISYLTIEHKDEIPVEYRAKMGNRIYGCDDCQLICPWNKYAELSAEGDFQARQQLDSSDLLSLFNWSEEEFLNKTQGSAIRRIGFEAWQRNIAIALGNGIRTPQILATLKEKREQCSQLVAVHIDWAIEQLEKQLQLSDNSPEKRLNARLVRSIEKGLPRDA